MKDCMRLRFLFSVRETYPPYRVDLTDLFSKGIAPRGHSIDWIMQSAGGQSPGVLRLSERETVYLGQKSSVSGILGKLLNVIYNLRHELRVARLIISNDYDFIQVRDKFFGALLAMAAAKLRGLPFFYWMSFPYPEADINKAHEEARTLRPIKRLAYLVRGHATAILLYKLILPRADHIFVQSQAMLDAVADRGVLRESMTPVPMGILLSRVSQHSVPPSNDSRLHGYKPVVYVGTLVAERRIEFLFDAMRQVLLVHPDAMLVLVGDADAAQMKLLKDKVTQVDMENRVLFTGFVPMEEAWSYIRAARVCVSYIRPHPILDVGSPTKVIEYMAWNRPVVANSHPDQAQVLKASGAGIVAQSTSDAFASAVSDLLGDYEAAERMAAKGFEFVRANRNYEALANLVEEKYIATIRQRRGHAPLPR